MISQKLLSHILVLFVSLAVFTAPLAAQQKTAQEKSNPAAPAKAAPKTVAEQPPVMIDSLLAADSYKIYGEVKNVGTLVHTGAFAELIDPVMKLADPPKEFKALVKFLNANAEPLANSKLLFATWPARSGIPKAFFVIELESPEEAAKFEPKLNKVLPVILPTPTPTPTPSGDEKTPAAAESPKPANDSRQSAQQKSDTKSQPQQGAPPEQPAPAPPPFVVSRSGNLVFVTDQAFKFSALRPADSKLLNEDQNFRQAHERFSTEPVFIFFNVALQDMNRVKAEAEAAKMAEEAQTQLKTETQASEQPTEMAPDPNEPPTPEETPEEPPPAVTATVTVQEPPRAVLSGTAMPAPTPNPQQASMVAIGSLMSLLTGGEPEWPDAVGVAIAQEADDYVIRSILVGPPNGKRLVLPFVPQLLAGHAYTPNAPSVLPDETELLVSASFDWPKTYQEMLARLEVSNKERIAEMRKVPIQHRSNNDEKPYDPFSEFEKKGGFKIKDDLLPALGNEIAIAGSMKSLQGAGGFMIMTPQGTTRSAVEGKSNDEAEAQKQREQEGGPMVLISVRDREAAGRLMPKILEGLGVGAANLIGTTVKRDDTEMVDFAGAFAYAFVGDFLVISTTATVRHVIDSHVNHQTLASNSAFRNFTRWQPRELVGQIYVSPALMESYQKAAHDPSQMIAAAMREYLLRLNPTPQPITYALSNEGFGAIHELHLPKSFVLASVAGAASATKEPPPEMNEAVAQSLLRTIVSAEATYKETTGKGSYGSLDKLAEAKLIASSKEMFTRYGYRIEVTASGNQFEATATPIEYGKTGRISYFVDQSGIIRGGDHGGGAASAADKQVQ